MSLIAKNAKLGDGCLYVQNADHAKNANSEAIFNGKNVQWVNFKRDLCIKEGYTVSSMSKTYSGYKKDYSLVGFRTRVHPTLTEFYKMPRIEVIKSLTKLDLILWYLDDGSWHKNKHFMHLYCNDLNNDEFKALGDKIESLYGIRPRERQDRKKDGRSYPYYYLQVALARKFKRDVGRFLKWLELESLYYKVGWGNFND